MKILGIAGSPRRSGNSATLLREVLAGALAAGAQVESVYLNGLLYRGCQDCRVCGPDGRGPVQDDLSGVLAKLPQADVWALATPIYYDGVSGQLKTFFDRCRYLTRTRDGVLRPQLAGPRAAVLIATYADTLREDYRRVMEVLAGYLKWMGDFAPIEVICEGSLGPADAAAKRPDLLERVRETGADVVRQLAARRGPGEPGF